MTETLLAAAILPVPQAAGTAAPRRRTRRRFWVGLGLTVLMSLAAYPPLWQSLVRAALVRQAARQGGELSIAGMDGGVFETLHLYGVRLRRHARSVGGVETGTDLRAGHAELTLSWTVPFFQAPAASRVKRLTLAGVSGRVDLFDLPTADAPAPRAVRRVGAWRWLDRLAARSVPESFFVQGDDVRLQRGRYHLRARGLRLTSERAAAGTLRVRETEIGGPSFRNTFAHRHGQTFWQGGRLTVTNVDFGSGLSASATLDGTRLADRRLLWDGALVAGDGGAVRGQGSVRFGQPRLALEVAGTLRGMSVEAMARLLGLGGPAGGTVEQGSFSFRGDPEDWTAAETWLTARARDFRWNQRACESLEVQAVLTHRRVEVRRLELRQSRNRVSLQGEWPLPPAWNAAGRWWEAGFTCRVDARLDDLHALALLLGSRAPDLAGRMSVNGQLEAKPGQPGVRGYFNVEGSRLAVRGLPLDYLRSTLIFQDGECQVADVQAMRGGDYFTGHGTVRLTGSAGYQGQFRVALQDPAAYAPALDGWLNFASADGSAIPMRLDGFFCGPTGAGETLVQTFGATDDFFASPLPLPVVALPEITTLHLN